jgi:tetratricopeptide (TPR) repeat protein
MTRQRWWFSLCLGLILVLTASNVKAQKRVALIIGVNNYEKGYQQLRFAASDAKRLAKALQHLGYSVTLFAADGGGGVVSYDAVSQMLSSLTTSLRPADTFVFYFAGHGSRRGGEDYLLLSDSDPDRFSDTALALSRLADEIKRCKATKRIVIMDACRSTSGSSSKGAIAGSVMTRDFKQRLDTFIRAAQEPLPGKSTLPQLAGVLYACSPGETSRESDAEEGGVFTVRLVSALNDGIGSLSSLAKAISDRLPTSLQGKQNPIAAGDATMSVIPAVGGRLWCEYGDIALERGDAMEAERLYKKAVNADPSYAESYLKLGTLYCDNEKYPQAREQLRIALSKNPKLGAACAALGQVCQDEEHPEEAKQWYLKALDLQYKKTDTSFQLGLICYQERQYDQALHYCQMGIAAGEPNLDGYNLLGSIYLKLQQYPQAEIYYKKALKAEPDNGHTNYNLGLLYGYWKKEEQALHYLQEAEKRGQDDMPIHNNLGALYMNRKEYALAEQQFRRALALCNTDELKARQHLNIAKLYYNQGRMDDARTEAREAISLGLTDDPFYADLKLTP